MTEIPKQVFRAYDIRGHYPEEINEDFAYILGIALVMFLREKKSVKFPKILVNRDARTASVLLGEALMRGIVDGGGNVWDSGVSTTPMHYFGVGTLAVHAGIMVTPSHGAVGMAGFKISTKKERIAEDTGLLDLYEIMQAQPKISKDKGSYVKFSMLSQYVNFLKGFVRLPQFGPLPRVAIDAAGGAVSIVLNELLTQIRVSADRLFFDIDPEFSSHSPNPLLPESQQYVKNKIKSNQYDLGVVFDGDGDRVIFFDEFGELIESDIIAALIAEEKLKYVPHKVVLLDFNASRASRRYIESQRGYVELSRVGTAFFRNRLQRDNDIIIGSESSGHYYYPEFFNSDAAILTFIYILNLRARSGKMMSMLTEPMRVSFRSGEINFTVRDRDAALAALKNAFANGRILTADGLIIEYKDWWLSARKSNTEPLVRVHIEADTKILLETKTAEINSLMQNS